MMDAVGSQPYHCLIYMTLANKSEIAVMLRPAAGLRVDLLFRLPS